MADSFTTFGGLKAAIAAWLNRDDLTARIPDFVRLTEARLNRVLRDPDQIQSTTLTFSSGSASLPTDFGQLVAFGPSGSRLSQVTPGEFGTYDSYGGDPQVYTLSAGSIKTLPQAGGTIPVTYYRAIPALSVDGGTNWLLTRAPDVYLYGSLVQAEGFGWNDERVPLIKSLFDESIVELRGDGENRRWGAAPLAARIRRS